METNDWSDSCEETSDFEDFADDSKDEELICLTDTIPKLQFRKGALKACWDDDLGMAEIVERKGKLLNTMGIIRDGKIYCSIEETLFLAEVGALNLVDNEDSPVSMQNMYEKVAGQQEGYNWEAFQIYRHLKMLGYIVGRHNVPWRLRSVKSNNGSVESSLTKDEASDILFKEVESIDSLLNNMLIGEGLAKPIFDVYLPNSQFRKSSPGHPDFTICSTGCNPPSIKGIEDLERHCNGIPLRFCNIEHGRVSFFSFDKVDLPFLP